MENLSTTEKVKARLEELKQALEEAYKGQKVKLNGQKYDVKELERLVSVFTHAVEELNKE